MKDSQSFDEQGFSHDANWTELLQICVVLQQTDACKTSDLKVSHVFVDDFYCTEAAVVCGSVLHGGMPGLTTKRIADQPPFNTLCVSR